LFPVKTFKVWREIFLDNYILFFNLLKTKKVRVILTAKRISGSYRDPNGQVYFDENNKIYRTINSSMIQTYKKMKADGIINASIDAGYLVFTQEISSEELRQQFDTPYVLQHEKIPYITYPYEWSFHELKAAALFHLEFQKFLLDRNYTLSDATAYNIQFIGHKPIFIDVLSIIPYQKESLWLGYQQFLEQFLNPLLLSSLKGIPFNSWYRGSLEGISTTDLLSTLSIKQKLNWRILLFLTLYQKAENKVVKKPEEALKKIVANQKGIPKKSLISMLTQLHSWIKKLEPVDKITVWSDYADINTYDNQERDIKAQFVSEFVARNKLKTLVDLGCNTGDYSQAAIEGGAEYVIGFDFDHQALSKAYLRSVAKNLCFLPLWLDASNPSPSQGWLESEREGFSNRFQTDGVIALAFEHHLAIAKNIPLEQVIMWITSIARYGVIEFVPKNDPTVLQMLSTREDIFPNYNQSSFEIALSKLSTIINKEVISKSGRILYEYKRS